MMLMINVVMNRELGRDDFHLLSSNSDVGRIHVHFFSVVVIGHYMIHVLNVTSELTPDIHSRPHYDISELICNDNSIETCEMERVRD